MGSAKSHQLTRKGKSMAIVTLGSISPRTSLRCMASMRHGKAGAGAAERGARQAASAGGGAAAVHDRHGGMLGRAPLGAASSQAHGHTVG